MLLNGVMPIPPAINTAARAGSSCSVIWPSGPTSFSLAPAGSDLSARLKWLPSRMRVVITSSLSCGALASENVRRTLFGSAGGSIRTKLADWPALKVKPAGFSKRNAVVPSATSSWPASVTSCRAMSERADFRELVRRLVALAVFVVPIELARLFVEGELVRAVAERLVLRQPAAAEPLLLAVDHVCLGLVFGALYDACHAGSPVASSIGWRGAPRRSRQPRAVASDGSVQMIQQCPDPRHLANAGMGAKPKAGRHRGNGIEQPDQRTVGIPQHAWDRHDAHAGTAHGQHRGQVVAAHCHTRLARMALEPLRGREVLDRRVVVAHRMSTEVEVHEPAMTHTIVVARVTGEQQ